MAITTLDGVIAGMQPVQPIVKVGITTAAVGAMRGILELKGGQL